MVPIRKVAAAMLPVCWLPLLVNGAELSFSAEEFDAAVRSDAATLSALVRNVKVEPHWIDGGDQFWYKRDTDSGHAVVIVDPSSGKRRPAFNMELMKAALERLIGSDSAGLASSPDEIKVGDDADEVFFTHAERRVICVALKPDCRYGQENPGTSDLLVSPLGKLAVFVRNNDLWVRDLTVSGETRLTDDGERYAAYGGETDQSNLLAGATDSDQVTRPVYTHWSPDGRWLITRRLDERQVESYPFLESAPNDGSFRPRVHEVRVTLLGDPNPAITEHFIIDIENRARYPIQLPDGFDLDDAYPGNSPLGWNGTGDKAYLYISSEDAKIGRLIEVDMQTGQTRMILEERAPGSRVYISPSFGRKPMVHIIGEELIWYSERSNYGHLYLYDLGSAKLKRQLTYGDGPVASILHVDTSRRSLLVSRARSGDADPYEQYVYRISLDDEAPVMLTPEEAHHDVAAGNVSPDGSYFVDSYSTLSKPPQTVLRSVWGADDTLPLEVADVSALLETGWRPPQRVRVMAADGKTSLYAALFHPYEQAAAYTKLPIIDFNYLNSIVSITPVGYMEGINVLHTDSLRRLGFYVVVIDGRGTPERSREFREAGYPAFADIQVEDHVAAIRQLADVFDGIDVERVGIWGSSNGGAGAARAILRRPDFYKVAVASAGSHDYMSLPPSGVKYFGVPSYEGGASVRPAPNAIPSNYAAFDNAALANNLEGHLLLVHGDMDNLALPAATHRLVNALIQSGKAFDQLFLPNRGHFFLYEPYFKRRLLGYFVEHLHGIDPLTGKR